MRSCNRLSSNSRTHLRSNLNKIMESGSDPRIERLKEVLSASYPRVEDQADLEPLPPSVAQRFQPATKAKTSLLARVASWLATPAPALGAVAIIVLCAVFFNRSEPPAVTPGPDIRSGGDSAAVASLVFVNAPDEVMSKFKASGYFPEELLSRVSSYTLGEASVIVLDWDARTITRNLPGEEVYEVEMPADNDELLELVLTLYEESDSE